MVKQIHYADNLAILEEMEDNYVDLIYLDPPFNSNRDYSAVFDDDAEKWDTAQLTAFEDTWHWNLQSEQALNLLRGKPQYDRISKMLDNFIEFLGKNDITAYLAMMVPRLIEMHRVLKDTGSFYLHCDSTVGHYLKIVLDQIFGEENFKNEIIWKRTYSHNDPKRFGRNTDKIFFYTKSKDYYFSPVYLDYDESYVKNNFRHEDERGKYQKVILTGMGTTKGDSNIEWKGYIPSDSKRHWSVPRRIVNQLVGEKKAKTMSITERLDLLYENDYIVFSKNGIPRFKQYLNEMPGTPAQECWTDISPIGSQAKERLGYPTQKPIALLERIIQASSKKGDLILDPFCGCGTALAAAERLKRNWIGIDITPLAVNVIEKRLVEQFKLKLGKDFEVVGDPADYAGAVKLAKEKDKYKFENWALRLLNCIPSKFKIEQGKIIPLKGGDGGFDGFAKFHKNKVGDFKGRLIAEVKSGKVGRRDIDIFIQSMEREKADMGIFVVLTNDSLSRDGVNEAGKPGFYKHELTEQQIPKIQVWSIENYFNNIMPILPFGGIAGHIQAQAIEEKKENGQNEMLF